jgi:hypothetical protein
MAYGISAFLINLSPFQSTKHPEKDQLGRVGTPLSSIESSRSNVTDSLLQSFVAVSILKLSSQSNNWHGRSFIAV